METSATAASANDNHVLHEALADLCEESAFVRRVLASLPLHVDAVGWRDKASLVALNSPWLAVRGARSPSDLLPWTSDPDLRRCCVRTICMGRVATEADLAHATTVVNSLVERGLVGASFFLDIALESKAAGRFLEALTRLPQLFYAVLGDNAMLHSGLLAEHVAPTVHFVAITAMGDPSRSAVALASLARFLRSLRTPALRQLTVNMQNYVGGGGTRPTAETAPRGLDLVWAVPRSTAQLHVAGFFFSPMDIHSLVRQAPRLRRLRLEHCLFEDTVIGFHLGWATATLPLWSCWISPSCLILPIGGNARQRGPRRNGDAGGADGDADDDLVGIGRTRRRKMTMPFLFMVGESVAPRENVEVDELVLRARQQSRVLSKRQFTEEQGACNILRAHFPMVRTFSVGTLVAKGSAVATPKGGGGQGAPGSTSEQTGQRD